MFSILVLNNDENIINNNIMMTEVNDVSMLYSVIVICS